MKRLYVLFLFSVAFTATVFAQSNQVKFSFDHKAGADPLVLNQTVFSIWNNKKVKLSRAEFYISEAEIHLQDNATVPLTDQFLLVNAANPTEEFDLGTWQVETAHGITMHLGVPQSVNHLDPASYPAVHPLSPQNPSMHWGWSAGYRFMAIEGKVDNNGDGVPETAFEFHNLFDALYKTVELTGMKEAENGVLHLHFVLDYAQLFKNMAMTGNLIQHGNAAPNVTMMDNAATQHFVAFPNVSATHEVEANSLSLKASPNPADEQLTIDYALPAFGPLEMILTNKLGQTVHKINGLKSSDSVLLETTRLPGGIYQYAFYENGKLLARKQLVIIH